MCNLDKGSVDSNVSSKRDKIPDRTQEPGDKISRSNVGEKSIVLHQRYRVDRDEELMLFGTLAFNYQSDCGQAVVADLLEHLRLPRQKSSSRL